jgi:signal transduction histidine kinase/CheY-like chemotaxis protein
MDALPVHISIISPSGDFIAVNDMWKQFAIENGMAGDDFITGYNYLDVCDSCAAECTDASTAGAGIRSVISGEATEFLMDYACHSPSHKRWFTMRAAPVDASVPASVIITHFNITERRNMETEILHKQKLESMGQLAGGVAHDFNNILTVIKSYGDLLLNELDLDPVHRRDIEEISRAADRATNLTKQLLAFSRKETVSPRVFDLNRQLQDVQSMLTRLIGEDVELILELENVPLTISIDPTHLEQVVVNLVVNSRDAMPRGGVLTLTTEQCELATGSADVGLDLTPGSYVRLSVTDSGTGMDPETLARVFEPFFTTKAEGMGTGLGLSTVFGIVHQAHGCVRVSSVQGRGTTFRLYFPRAAMPDKAETVVPIKAEQTNQSGRILFVEDEASLRKLGCRILEKNGFQVRVAADYNDAMKICEESVHPFDLACIDVVMPGRGGGDLAVSLLAKYPKLKILMMSGFNDDELLRRGIGDKKIPFIQKPYSPEALVHEIRNVLAGKGFQGSPYLRLA